MAFLSLNGVLQEKEEGGLLSNATSQYAYPIFRARYVKAFSHGLQRHCAVRI